MTDVSQQMYISAFYPQSYAADWSQLISEFNLEISKDPHEIIQSLTYTPLTPRHCCIQNITRW